MNTVSAPAPDEPGQDYWRDLAMERLELQTGLKPGNDATACEKKLWKRLVALQAAAYRVLSDVDDDGIAEAHDMAILGLRQAVDGPPEPRPGQRVIKATNAPKRRVFTK